MAKEKRQVTNHVDSDEPLTEEEKRIVAACEQINDLGYSIKLSDAIWAGRDHDDDPSEWIDQPLGRTGEPIEPILEAIVIANRKDISDDPLLVESAVDKAMKHLLGKKGKRGPKEKYRDLLIAIASEWWKSTGDPNGERDIHEVIRAHMFPNRALKESIVGKEKDDLDDMTERFFGNCEWLMRYVSGRVDEEQKARKSLEESILIQLEKLGVPNERSRD